MSLTSKRVAVVGLGGMGLRHVSAYAAGGATIVAASDLRPEKKAELESAAPGAAFYQSWEELLKKEQLDMVSVVTNGPSHADIVTAAAQAKVPVIMCEKPMATSMAEAKRMQDICAAEGSRLYINFTLRAFPAFQKLIALCKDGTIGDVRIVSVSIGGARGLGCVGSHYVDLMRLILGEPVRVHGRLDTSGTPNPRGPQFRDPGGWGVYEFANGARGILEMGEDYSLPPYLTVVGSKGRAVVDIAQNRWQVEVLEGREWSVVPFEAGTPTDLTIGTQSMLEDAAALGGMVSTGDDGFAALGMILGIHAADKHKTPIVLPLATEFADLSVPMT